MVTLDDNDEPEVDAVEAKRRRKLAKRAAAQAQVDEKRATDEDLEAEAIEAKKRRKAAKRAAAEAAMAEAALESEEPKKSKKSKKNKAIENCDENVEPSSSMTKPIASEEEPSGKVKSFETVEEPLGKGASKVRQSKEFEVFVSGLHDSATDDDVKQHFTKCGTIVGFNMPRGSDGSHRGKAFIEFESKDVCEKALQMNNTLFKFRLLVVRMATDRIPLVKTNADVDKWKKDLEVVVGGLPFSMTEDDVRKKFVACGKIIALRMPQHLKKKGVAFIAFANKEACKEALSLHGSICDGRPLFVHKSGSGNKNEPAEQANSAASTAAKDKGEKEFEVFVGGLPFSTTEKVLRKDFSECGELKSLRMVVNSEGSCKGSAFLEYKSKDACEKALAYDGTEYGGRLIRVRMAADGGSQPDKGKGKGKSKGKNKTTEGKSGKANKEFEIVVTGLPFSTTAEILRKDFEECGEVLRLVLPLTDEGHAKGNAYIEFASKEACEKALEYHDTSYGGRWIRVRMSNDRTSSGGASSKDSKSADAGGSVSRANVVTFDSDDE